MTNDPASLDPVRLLILTKLKEKNITLKKISKDMGKNEAYFSQYIWRHSPRFLQFDVQEVLSKLLNVPVESLRGGKEPMCYENLNDKIGFRTDGPLIGKMPIGRGAGLCPIYECPGILSDAAAIDWVSPPGPYAGAAGSFGLWINHSIGRLRGGDLVFVRPAQPADEGTIGVVAQGERLLAIGEVIGKTDAVAIFRSNKIEKSYELPMHRVMKVTSVVFR